MRLWTLPLVCWSLVLLSSHSRPTWMRYREALLVGAMLQMACLTVDGLLNGGENVYGRHANSPLLLLFIMSVSGAGRAPARQPPAYMARDSVSRSTRILPALPPTCPQVCNVGFCLGLHAVVFRLSWLVGVIALPLLALALAATASTRMCDRALAAPGVHEPLASLYSWIGLLQ